MRILQEIADAEAAGRSRRQIFTTIWQWAHEAAGRPPPALRDAHFGAPVPHLSEPWYCCAEPTSQQLDLV